MNRKEEIKEQIGKLAGELQEIADRETDEQRGGWAGKCYKYHNSYGYDDEKWWAYTRVNATGDRKFEFERDCNGEAKIDSGPFFGPLDESIEIAPEECENEWDNLMESLDNQWERFDGE